MDRDQVTGLALAVSSSLFIGTSYIIKKKGLRRASATGLRAGAGGFTYLRDPVWWLGLMTMVVGELANFAAYAFAPAMLVTPLGSLSIIVSAIFAHIMLNEKLNIFGMTGCLECIAGSTIIVLHVPEEIPLHSVLEVWEHAMQPGFLMYALAAVGGSVYLAWVVAPKHGATNIFVYLAICSLIGSLTVVSCKGLGIAIKLTVEGSTQLWYPQTYLFAMIVAACVVTQMNYLNKSLDLFNTAIVSPLYYVMFTSFTILASLIMFQNPQSWWQITSEVCGFLTVVGGTFLLHTTKDMEVSWSSISSLARRQQTGGTHNSKKDDASRELLPLVATGEQS
eukprot:evm.model.scf_155.3 EVM.evm.TU.scf_155.3   scf_155:38102-43904(-)